MSKGRCQDYTNIEVWTDLFLWLEQPEFSDQPFSYQSDALHLQVVLFHVNQMKCIFKLFLKKKKLGNNITIVLHLKMSVSSPRKMRMPQPSYQAQASHRCLWEVHWELQWQNFLPSVKQEGCVEVIAAARASMLMMDIDGVLPELFNDN